MWLRALIWDLRLQLRYQIFTVATVVTVIWVALLYFVPPLREDRVLLMVLFSDQSVFGFFFIGVLVLFERGANTLEALVVTALSSAQYLWAKAVSLTLLATASGLALTLAARGLDLRLLPLVVSLVLTSIFFVFLGFVGVSRCRTVNEYLLVVPFVMLPINLPVLRILGIFDSVWFYAVPTHASLLLFEAAFEPKPTWQIVYSVLFLGLAVGLAFAWALRSFERCVRVPGGGR